MGEVRRAAMQESLPTLRLLGAAGRKGSHQNSLKRYLPMSGSGPKLNLAKLCKSKDISSRSKFHPFSECNANEKASSHSSSLILALVTDKST